MTFTPHYVTSQAAIPMHMGVRGVVADDALRQFTCKRLSQALGRFADKLRDAHVWLEDVNGPRGGVDNRCRIELRLSPRGRVTVTAEAASAHAAIASTVKRCAIVLDRTNKRNWTFRNQRSKHKVTQPAMEQAEDGISAA